MRVDRGRDESSAPEEELDLATLREEVGRIRARKVVQHERVEQVVPGGIEHAATEHIPAGGG